MYVCLSGSWGLSISAYVPGLLSCNLANKLCNSSGSNNNAAGTTDPTTRWEKQENHGNQEKHRGRVGRKEGKDFKEGQSV